MACKVGRRLLGWQFAMPPLPCRIEGAFATKQPPALQAEMCALLLRYAFVMQ